MKKNKNRPVFKDIEVKATVELVTVYTVESNRSEADRKKWLADFEHQKKLVRQKNVEYFKNSQGQPIVRRYHSNIKCFFLGPLLRETPKYYIYAKDGHLTSAPNDSLPIERVWKESAHIEYCKRCTDHPNSNFAAGGWWGQ